MATPGAVGLSRESRPPFTIFEVIFQVTIPHPPGIIPGMNRRTILHDTCFRHATVLVYTHVRLGHALDDQPLFTPPSITDTYLAVSLHERPVSRTHPYLAEMHYPGYRRLWIPRDKDVWVVKGNTAQMYRMWDFPPTNLGPNQLVTIPAYALWMGDAVISTGWLPTQTQLETGSVLSIAFQIEMYGAFSPAFWT